MRILAVHPGASYSTADVHNGITTALAEQGHEIIHYRLDGHIATAGGWLKYVWNRRKRQGLTPEPYTAGDIVFQASVPLLERALRFQPDWVLVTSAMYLHPDILIMLKRAGLRTAIILTESPYDEPKEARVLPFVDVAWTNERTSVARLRAVNPNVHYLPHAFDPAKHTWGEQPGDEDVAAHDVCFVGTYFQERLEILSGVDWTGIDLGLYGDYKQIPSRSKLRQYIRGGIQPNARTAALYRRAQIGLNVYRTSMGFGRHQPRVTDAESLNPRALELAATGCFHVSDYRPEVEETFGGLVPTFRTAAELEQRIRAWLPATVRRAMVASQLPVAVAGHTFAARAEQIIADLARVTRPALALAGG